MSKFESQKLMKTDKLSKHVNACYRSEAGCSEGLFLCCVIFSLLFYETLIITLVDAFYMKKV